MQCRLLRPLVVLVASLCYIFLPTPALLNQSGVALANELTSLPGITRETFMPRETNDTHSLPPFRIAQNVSSLTLSVVIDSKRNGAYVKADDQFHSYVYEAVPTGDTIKIHLASKDIMEIWKGNATIKELGYADKAYFEVPEQFTPVFVVAQVRNDGTSAAQVTSAYLDISESATDFQPYLEIGGWGRLGCGGGYNPQFDMRNLGWGPVSNGRLVYTFSAGSTRSSEFTATLGSFDQTTMATVEGGLRSSGVNIEQIKSGKFQCPSKSQVPACLSKLKQSGILGNLADYVYSKESQAFTNVSGSIQYDWTDANKNINHRVSPFNIVIGIADFSGGPECGAPGPVDRNEKPIMLSLDRQNYRIPIEWHGQLKSRQISSFALSLAAEKSSHHAVKLVLTLADGNSLSSSPLDISYFTPRIPPPPLDTPDDRK